MKRVLVFAFVFALVAGTLPRPAAASPIPALESKPICLPEPYGLAGDDCEDLGPSAYFGRLADAGIHFPLRSLPALQTAAELSYLPYSYARVTGQPGRVFASLDDAIAGEPVKRTIDPGFDFVSYTDVYEIDGWKYYMIDIGEWMRSDELSVGLATSQFRGLAFAGTPEHKFGWMLQLAYAQTEPGLGAPTTDTRLVRFDVVQVYDQVEEDGLTWNLIGPDLWIESRQAALVYPRTEAPQGVGNGRYVDINLYEQTLAVYENDQLVFATLMASGVPGFWTRPGLFQVYEKLERTPMSGAFEADRSDYYYLQDVPWTLYFDEARALHGAYWHAKYGYEQSHGCVNLSPGDANWLYQWADVGDWIYVWDPSGQTPEDPELYGSGGA